MAKGIERHVTFHVLPEDVAEFENFFEQEYRPAMEETDGFTKTELLKDTENPQDLKMVLRFESSDAAPACRHALINHRICLSLIPSIMAASSCFSVFVFIRFIASNKVSTFSLMVTNLLTVSFPFRWLGFAFVGC